MAYRDCPHADGVICDQQVRCSVCGWNPQVAEFRRNKRMQPKQDKKSRPGESSSEGGRQSAHS